MTDSATIFIKNLNSYAVNKNINKLIFKIIYRSFCKHDSDALEHTMIERVDRLRRYIPLLTVK